MSPRESTSPATTNLSAPIAKSLEEQLKAIRQQAAKITQPLQQANSLEAACRDVVVQLQQVFECDRALIYRLCDRSIDAFIDQFQNPMSGLAFNGGGNGVNRPGLNSAIESGLPLTNANGANLTGTVVAEAVGRGWTPSLGDRLHIAAFGFETLDDYQNLGFISIADQSRTNLTPHQQQILDRYQVQAALTIPLKLGQKLWGVLSVQHCRNPYSWSEREIAILRQVAAELISFQQSLNGHGTSMLDPNPQQVEDVLERLRNSFDRVQDRDRSVARVIERIRQSLNIDIIFRTTTKEVRLLLKCDRVAVYQFNPDFSGQFVAESVTSGWVKLVGEEVERVWKDTYLEENQGGRYANHETYAVSDIYTIGHDPCHVELLEQFEARAYTLVPIFQGEHLWGILAAYQNDGPREWQNSEVDLLQRIADQLGVALQQAETVTQLRRQSDRIRQAAERDRTVAQVIDRIRQSLDINSIFNVTTKEVRLLLQCDRIAVYQFNPDFSGQFVAESVTPGWGKLVGPEVERVWKDTYLEENQGGRYAYRETYAVTDIYEAGHDPCHVELLEQFEARAYTLVPIFQGETLWGILAAYQNDGPREWQEDEVQLLVRIADQLGVALQQAETVQELRRQSERIARTAERERAVAQVIERIRESLNLDTIFDTTTTEVRRLLKTDRVCVYQFAEDWSGSFIAESVGATWAPLVQRQQQIPALRDNVSQCDNMTSLIERQQSGQLAPQASGPASRDTYLQETEGGRFQTEQAFSVEDIYQAGFSTCYLEVLEQYQCRAYAIVPIFKGPQLWGLLAAYQNNGPRDWENEEVTLLRQIGTQLGVAIQQSEYLQQLQEQSLQLEAAAQRDKAAKEQLQKRALELLMAVRPALDGDLTVRIPVTEDEMGTLADSFNNTLQSLRKIVMQVQTAAGQVVQSSQSSDASLMELSDQAQKQFEEISKTLDRIQDVVGFTQTTANNAQQVEVALQGANRTLEAGDDAMNRTVEGIADIRQTVAAAAKGIARLTQSSQNIAKVVNLINNFATQTNLLALNAAIEATRAGEYGRGFAVVADEVRSLARQSADATTEIENLVQEIQAETKDVTLAMEMASEQVTKGTNLVGETRQTLNEIVTATAQIGELVQGITHATQVQTEQAQSVTEMMRSIAEIANQTSENSIAISSRFKDALTTAQELQSSAGQFKVS
ncbi:GAF domain-containing protein [Sodalinema gerasimenkoae]|uniref:GAF domain-containing protein n=1 Tax=Sodalinema gerasimenkoae TaxID=2862348 RepID=UPI00085F5BD5|nr:GAF domain-containing protein [Sodalinema gerasimenkoae]